MKYISINGNIIRRNARYGYSDPPIRIAKSPKDRKPVYVHEIGIVGDSQLVYSPKEPLMSCGARLVLICDDVKGLPNGR